MLYQEEPLRRFPEKVKFISMKYLIFEKK